MPNLKGTQVIVDEAIGQREVSLHNLQETFTRKEVVKLLEKRDSAIHRNEDTDLTPEEWLCFRIEGYDSCDSVFNKD